jgi:hypothetical protein
MADGSLANLPALDLEDPLHRVFVELPQALHGSITKRRLASIIFLIGPARRSWTFGVDLTGL